MSQYSISTWDGGIDKISAIDSKPFQLPNPDSPFEDRSKQFLRSALNVTLDNSSKPMMRPGLASLGSTTSCTAVHCTHDYTYFQDGLALNRRSSAGVVTLVATLSSAEAVKFFDYTDGLYYYSSTDLGRIIEGVATNWGCSVCPSPTLGTTTGTLKAGTYQVAVTFIDANGIEHAADESSSVVLTGPGGITVNLPSLDANATHVNVYATKGNNIGLFYVATVAVGSLPYTIASVSVEEYLLETQFLSPPEDIDALFAYNGAMMSCTGAYIYPSLGANHHVFDKKLAVEARPSNIVGGSGLKGGFWTACEHGAFWTSGDDPVDWDTTQVDDFRYAKGSLVIPGYLLGFVKSQRSVALFVSEHGLMVGSDNGSMEAVNHHKIHLDVEGKTAHFAYDRDNESNQIIFFLE